MSIEASELASRAKQLRSNAKQLLARNKTISRSACHDGKRQMNVGMAAAYEAEADWLEGIAGKGVEPPALPRQEFVSHDDQ